MVFVIVIVVVIGTRETLVAVLVYTIVDVIFSVDVGVGMERQPQAVVSSEHAKVLQLAGAVAHSIGSLVVIAFIPGFRANRALAAAASQTAVVLVLHHRDVSHPQLRNMKPAIEHTFSSSPSK